jgi:hypothetical protein
MDKKIIKGLIDEKLETIQEQFSIIRAYEGKIPNIEIDLAMANVRDLYELFIALQAENQGSMTGTQKPDPVISQPLPPVAPAQPKEDTATELETEDKEQEQPVSAPTARRSPAILGFEPVVEKEPEPEHITELPATPEIPDPLPEPYRESFTATHHEPEAEPPSPTPEPQDAPAKHPKITFDLFSDGSGSTLADRLKSTQEKRVADRLQENKFTDLRTTIGINDKFLFINELFEGNMRIYDEAVQKLGESTTMAQADIMLLDLKIVYNWDGESPTVKKFVELVRRKFA